MLGLWMLGQAVGGAWGGSRYAVSEGAGAAGILLFPGLAALLPGMAWGPRVALAAAGLLAVTVPLGATYPGLCRLPGARPDRVFAWGTLGAVGGVALATGFLIPELGLKGSCLALGAGKVALAVSAWRIRAGMASGSPGASSRADVVLAFVLGVVVMGAEVVWARLLTVRFSSAVVALAGVLAAFLLGLGIGTLAAPRLKWGQRGAGWACVLGALGVLASVPLGVAFGDSAATLEAWEAAGSRGRLGGLLAAAVLLMLPATLCWGAALGALLETGSPRILYAAHTLGGVAGCAGVSLWLMPSLGAFQKDLSVLALLSLLGGLGWIKAGGLLSFRRGAVLTVLAATVCVGAARLWRGPSIGLERGILDAVHSRITWSDGRVQTLKVRDRLKAVHYREGSLCTVAVLEDPATGDRHLLTDSFFVAGTGPEYAYMRMEGHLPALLARGSERALLVGFGTGATLDALACHPFRAIDVAEIAPEVMEAAPCFEASNRGVLARDARVRAIHDDARCVLAAGGAAYDVITCEPPIPYLAGGSALFTREFYRACRARLAAGGVFCQWIPQTLYAEDARLLVRTFRDAFPDGSVWFPGSTMLLLGGPDAVPLDLEALAARLAARPEAARDLARLHVDRAEALLAQRWCGPEGARRFAGPGPLLTADCPVLEFFRGRGPVRDSMAQAWDLLAPCREDPAAAVTGWGGQEATRRAWLRRWSDLTDCGYAWNRVRLLPFLDRPARFTEIARRAAPLLPPGVSAAAYFDGRDPAGIARPLEAH